MAMGTSRWPLLPISGKLSIVMQVFFARTLTDWQQPVIVTIFAWEYAPLLIAVRDEPKSTDFAGKWWQLSSQRPRWRLLNLISQPMISQMSA